MVMVALPVMLAAVASARCLCNSITRTPKLRQRWHCRPQLINLARAQVDRIFADLGLACVSSMSSEWSSPAPVGDSVFEESSSLVRDFAAALPTEHNCPGNTVEELIFAVQGLTSNRSRKMPRQGEVTRLAAIIDDLDLES
jgi:hypothetical protein